MHVGTRVAIPERVNLRTKLAFVFATLLGTGCAPASDTDDGEQDDADETSQGVTDGRVLVRFGEPGSSINSWGYDIKQEGRSKAMKPALARELFGDGAMNMLRIAVRAKDGHPRRGLGKIADGAYADDLDAIHTVQAVKPDVRIFASLKLLGPETFPGWVKSGGKVDADAYAALLRQYLQYMDQNGVTVDVLGIDCEQRFNKGGITPAKYNQIISDVRSFCQDEGLKVPDFVAGEDYGPGDDIPWVDDLWQSGAKFSNVDHVGVHLYSKHRDPGYVDAIGALAQRDHGKGMWDTEFHWNDLDDDGPDFQDVKPGMLLFMDHVDARFHSITWWAFQPRSMGTKSAYIMSDLVESTLGAAALPTNDMDGPQNRMNKFNSRAFKNGPKEATLWVANYGPGRPDQRTEIANRDIESASYVRWSVTTPIQGVTGDAKVVKKKQGCFDMSFPADTITRVTVRLK